MTATGKYTIAAIIVFLILWIKVSIISVPIYPTSSNGRTYVVWTNGELADHTDKIDNLSERCAEVGRDYGEAVFEQCVNNRTMLVKQAPEIVSWEYSR